MNNDIIRIEVVLSNNGRKIEYYVNNGKSEKHYTERTIPDYVSELMNKNDCLYHKKASNGNETIVYRF